jgi:hypothetical protein
VGEDEDHGGRQAGNRLRCENSRQSRQGALLIVNP